MKHLQKKYAVIAIMIATVSSLLYCTKQDQIIDEYSSSDDQLVSLKVTTGPILDGTIDASWANCQKLTTTVTVPDPGNDYFKGYVGNSKTVSLRSMYDGSEIYYLAEWNDADKSLNREPWYFDPVAKKWEEESNKPAFDANGKKIREAFYEDKFAMLWNINNSVTDFNTKGCYATCHTSLDPLTHGGATGRHFTGSSTEFLDMWHWKLVRTGLPNSQFDDQLQNNTEFDLKDGGRHGDPKVSGGYSDNVQTLPVTGGEPGQTMNVPKYFVPGSTNYYWILKSDQISGTAKLITSVDVNGILSYSGGTIDPNTGVQFQRNGESTGSKCISSVCDIAPFVGDRGDISAMAIFTGSGWILEYSRSLTTPSGIAGNSDVQFDITSNYVFGIAVFDNATIAHAINPKFTLKFEK
ncbi:MAG: ethylbenzene dehydrogenase-related protein [Bacteroidales bacterium]|nr:ethylbenzene dehydrogenase-related protein [Bacteroidales bacterium]